MKEDLHSGRVQVLKGDVRNAVGFDVTVEDLKQIGAAAGQHGTVGHQLMTTHLEHKDNTFI